MLGWLRQIFGGTVVAPGFVWPSRDAMWSGVVADVAHARGAGTAVVVVAHFRDTVEAVFRRLSDAGTPVRTSAGTLDVGALGRRGEEVPVVRSDALAFGGRALVDRADGWLRVIVVERYPLRSREDALERAVASVAGARVAYHTSLDDALLREFGGPRLRELLARLGQAADESIAHPMIERAIRNAQRKLGRAVARDVGADSAEQWFALNRRTAG